MPLINSSEQLTLALSQAEPRGPSGLPQADAGAVLALACHCIMVDYGLKCELPGGEDPIDRWAPPPKWATKYQDEWVFRYNMSGKRNTLVLHCSLQRASGRMLVHAVEVNNDQNSQFLGLQLEKYVPDNTLLRSRDWKDVIQHGEALVFMMQQHVVAPLLETAEDIPAEENGVDDVSAWAAGVNDNKSWWRWFGVPGGSGAGGSYVVPAVVITGLAVAGIAWYVAHKRR